MVIGFVALYLLVSGAIGLYATKWVKNSSDYAMASRALPLYMVVTTTFATWFGSELVLGVSSVFIQKGLAGVVEDPFGASLCLVVVGLFFAGRLYKLNLLTIGSYYRERYGTVVEILMSVVIILSYLGWVAAQVKALGLVFHMLAPDLFSQELGMIVGIVIVLVHTMFGGMWSVAVTDFLQMIVVVVGLIVIAWIATGMVGGIDVVMAQANSLDLLKAPSLASPHDALFFFAALMTMMFGSIPQQDVYQRVMSANNIDSARRGPVIGGICYLLFAFVPMYIAVSAFSIMPEEVKTLLADDPQKILPNLILGHMPVVAQVFFFGALLSAIMSTASATLLAPSTTFAENILRHIRPNMNDKQFLFSLRASMVAFTACVLVFALHSTDSIYEMVAGAYTVTLVGAFIPLVFGLYWKRATTQGALLSAILGTAAWLTCKMLWAEVFPPALAGLGVGLVAMVLGSLLPQVLRSRVTPSLHPVI